MINLIKENLDTSIAIATLFISVFVIFLGLNELKKTKPEQLKFILISYAVVILIILFSDVISFFLFFVWLLFFFLGGLSYSLNEQYDLEKELNIIQLLLYSSFAWLFITSSYFLFFSIIVIYTLNTKYYVSLIIVSIFLVFQYLLIVKDYFGIESYKKTFDELKKN